VDEERLKKISQFYFLTQKQTRIPPHKTSMIQHLPPKIAAKRNELLVSNSLNSPNNHRYEAFLNDENWNYHWKKRTHVSLYRFKQQSQYRFLPGEFTNKISKSLAWILKLSSKHRNLKFVAMRKAIILLFWSSSRSQNMLDIGMRYLCQSLKGSSSLESIFLDFQ